MGCPISKLNNEEAVRLCKDRKRFVKEAIESRVQFASGHVAYIQSLRQVSLALVDYIKEYENHELLSNSYTSHPFAPIKKMAAETVSIPFKSLNMNSPIKSYIKTSHVITYLRSGGNPLISIEKRPQSPEIMRIESYYPADHYGIEGFFNMQSPPTNSPHFSSPYNRPSYPPPSPQTSRWDFFWNPFSSLDTYGYPIQESLDRTVSDSQTAQVTQLREEEGTPDLEEELQGIKDRGKAEEREERSKIDVNCATEEIEGMDSGTQIDTGTKTQHEVKGLQSQATERIEVSEVHNAIELEIANEYRETSVREETEETSGYTVYVDRRPMSMEEVVKDLDTRFKIVCDSAKEVSTILEASEVQFSNAKELTAAKMLNPIALFRSASHSTLSRSFQASSSSRDDSYDSGSDIAQESLVFCGSHQSTLDRLYAWEKKLYEEVKSGERVRIAYEKKCMQLKNQDSKGEDPSVLDKTRVSVRDLHTQIKVSMHSVESVSKRIETLRDEELQPQLMELIQGLARMWRVMAECHSSQKQTIQDGMLFLSKTAPGPTDISAVTILPQLGRSATVLVSELRNWRHCFQCWIAAQRSYVRALASWALRCARPSADTDTVTKTPRRSTGDPSIFPICIQWSRRLDALREAHVADGLETLAAVVVSAYGRDGDEMKRSRRNGFGLPPDTDGKMELAERGEITVEKTEDMAIWALCEGMSVAVTSLAEYAISSAGVYEEIISQWEKDTWAKVKVGF